MSSNLEKEKINVKGIVGIWSKREDNKDNSVVVMAHGLRSNKNSRTWLVFEEIFNREGIDTVRMDLFAHGESKGEWRELTTTRAMESIRDVIDFLIDEGYERLALIGSSFGGLASLVYASEYDTLELLALKAPVSNLTPLIEKKFTKEEMQKWREEGVMVYYGKPISYSFYSDKNNNVVSKAARIRANTLIVHGDADDVVPLAQSEEISKRIPRCKLITINGADHRFRETKHFRAMVSYISSFILREWRDREVWIQ